MFKFILNYIAIPVLNWGNLATGLIILFLAAAKYFNWFKNFSKLSYKSLIWITIGFKIIYAGLATLSQYYVWSSNAFTKLLLNQNIIDFNAIKDVFGRSTAWIFDNRLGYFLFYSWGRFWMVVAVSLVVALAFYLFLIFLKKQKERFFEEGETELGFLLALLVGWPNFIVFIPIVFLSVVLVSAFRMVFVKEMYTTLGRPFLLAAFLVILSGNYIINWLGLMSFRV